ncbi:MAG: hypothetical protein ABIT09_06685 [Croceibacterium sp.]
MNQVTITGLDRVREPTPTLNGHLILAYFTADVGVFSIKGLALVRTAKGGLAAWLPSLTDSKAKTNRSITLTDEPTRSALLQAALKMYRMMGGTDAEYQPRETPERSTEDDSHHGICLPPPIRVVVPVVRRKETAE